MKENKNIKDELELFIYYKIKEAMKKTKVTNEILAESFDITAPGVSQRIFRGNYRYVFLRKLFPILKLNLLEVTKEFEATKQKKG
jgi:hypothetical protein